MKNNVLSETSENLTASCNEKTKFIKVNISQCLSSTEVIEVPEDFEDYDNKEALEDFVREQVMLPSDCLENEGFWWCIDDFCVSI